MAFLLFVFFLQWIDLQLHPERITGNPILEAKLKPFETLQLSMFQIFEKYPLVQLMPAMISKSAAAVQSLTPVQSTTLFMGTPEQILIANRGTVDEKRALIASLDPQKRKQVFRSLPPRAPADLPDYRREAMASRQPQELSTPI